MPSPPASASAFGPGRVNLIGEHTDYNQGLALPFAIAQGIKVQAERQDAPWIDAVAADLGESDRFGLERVEPVSDWRGFVRGAVGELQRKGIGVPGARLTISGTVPIGSGLSSSAALETALVLALLELAGRPEGDRTELARLCSRIENHWVGARTGLLDQMAGLHGKAGHALRIDFRTLEVRQVPLELHGHRLVTLDSGERHANAESGYNQRRAECVRACELLGIASLRDATPEMAARLPDPLDRRARHVIGANQRVEAAVSALLDGDIARVGRLLNESHASLRDLYEISTPAVERAVERLRAAGALGARILGGGFGGHVLGLMAPGGTAPEHAVEVAPAQGARLLTG